VIDGETHLLLEGLKVCYDVIGGPSSLVIAKSHFNAIWRQHEQAREI